MQLADLRTVECDLGQHIARYTWHRKFVNVREYTRKKRRMCYDELKTPKKEHTLWRWDGDREVGIYVPKIVYDHFTDIPEAEYADQRPEAAQETIVQETDACPVCGAFMDWMNRSGSALSPDWQLVCGEDESHTPDPSRR